MPQTSTEIERIQCSHEGGRQIGRVVQYHPTTRDDDLPLAVAGNATLRRRHRHSPSPAAPLAVAAASVPVNFPGITFSNGIKAAFYAVFLEQLSDTVLGALLASHETVAIALSFVLYYLADHPDVYAKVLKGTKLFCAFQQRFYCRLLEKSGRDRGVGIADTDPVIQSKAQEENSELYKKHKVAEEELRDDIDAESSETTEDAEVAFDDGGDDADAFEDAEDMDAEVAFDGGEDMDAEGGFDDGEDMDAEVPRETDAETIVDVGAADTEVVAEVEEVVVEADDEVEQMDAEVASEVGSMDRGVVEEVGVAEKAVAYLVEPIVHSSPSPVPVEAVESPFGGQIGSSHMFEGSD
ncbi:hypothetical protein RJ640_002324, partial [Escallonia rubra]